MPTLDWIGKDKVLNHHNEVPYRILDKKYSYGSNAIDDNMIIHGDNLEALKSLLPRYEGKIKCIYIDPPYNTGNEGWVYNDNVNDPQIKAWLGKVVGKDGEDLSRHDKWLCMMYPRLRLLQKLLAADGAIFISIDDNELYNLKLICDEIFGKNSFVADISWQRTYSMRNDSKGVPVEIEHILVYSKNINWIPLRLPRTDEMNANYKNPDNDVKGKWQNTSAFAPGGASHQGMVYAVQHPFTGEMIYPTMDAHWRYQQEQMLQYMLEWCPYEYKDLHDEKERAIVCGLSENDIRKGVKGIVLSQSLEISRERAQNVYDKGNWPRFFFTNKGKGGIRRKTYLDNLPGKAVTNYWGFSEVGHTDEAKKELLSIFDGKNAFDTPKPTRLIERIIHIATDKDSIILDSFAGSGTTAHAVLNMNKADGGKRKFILIEMMDYAENITAERVRRVIDGYGDGKNAVEGTGGGFSYYELGERLMLDHDTLNPNVPADYIRQYIWHMETRQPYTDIVTDDNKYFLSVYNDTAYYFYYEKDIRTVLDAEFLKTIKTKAGRYTIYADTCTISDKMLQKFNITYKKIPRDIAIL